VVEVYVSPQVFHTVIGAQLAPPAQP
jgi:hypothetical protein